MLPISLIRFLGWDRDWPSGLLGDFPARLRPHAVEIAAVERGAKPIARVTARRNEVDELLSWLFDRGLHVLVREQRIGPDAFAQVAPQWRPNNQSSLHQLFIGTRWESLAAINRSLRAGDYRAIGEALGYPACCAAWAAACDRHIETPMGATRQTNLIDKALAASEHHLAMANCLARESAFAAHMPVSLISHYPCRFDCPATCQQAALYASCLAEISPPALGLLERLLMCPTAWWSDLDWPLECASEFPGMILAPDATSLDDANFVALSDHETAGGSIPANGTVVAHTERSLLLLGPNGPCEIDLSLAGPPRLISWE